MALLKQIAGHTSCVPVQRYLEHKMRAIAKELYNFDEWDERDSEGRDPAERDAVAWGMEMDALRRACGNDAPWRGSPARTYKHFVISPPPSDNVSLEDLMALARDWALAHYRDHQIAIICHNDNANRIPHAHIVVNNTNLATGRRMHDDSALDLNRDLQKLAHERGLSAFGIECEPASGYARLSKKRGEESPKGRTSQRRMCSRAEAELARKEQYSWVADLRDRVTVARSLATSQPEFVSVLAALGVEVSDSSRRSGEPDWVFSLADQPTRRVCGGKLGASYSRQALERSLPRRAGALSREPSQREIARRARMAIEVKDIAELHELSEAVDAVCRYRLDSIEACNRALSRLCARAVARPAERRSVDAEIAKLDSARRTISRLNLLPDVAPRRRDSSAGASSSNGWTRNEHLAPQGRTPRAQQHSSDERPRR